MSRILIIEDDLTIRNELATLLVRYGHEAFPLADLKNVLEAVSASDADLILLDINLPYFDGYHICREIRKTSTVPIIIITSRNSDLDEVMSMNLGADDFVTKPYSASVLLARIDAVLRRSSEGAPQTVLCHGGLQLDIAKSCMTHNDQTVELSKNELRILHILMAHHDAIVSRQKLMNELWQSEEFIDDNTLTVNVNRIRKKLEFIGLDDFLKTKRGQGYLV